MTTPITTISIPIGASVFVRSPKRSEEWNHAVVQKHDLPMHKPQHGEHGPQYVCFIDEGRWLGVWCSFSRPHIRTEESRCHGAGHVIPPIIHPDFGPRNDTALDEKTACALGFEWPVRYGEGSRIQVVCVIDDWPHSRPVDHVGTVLEVVAPAALPYLRFSEQAGWWGYMVQWDRGGFTMAHPLSVGDVDERGAALTLVY